MYWKLIVVLSLYDDYEIVCLREKILIKNMGTAINLYDDL